MLVNGNEFDEELWKTCIEGNKEFKIDICTDKKCVTFCCVFFLILKMFYT